MPRKPQPDHLTTTLTPPQTSQGKHFRQQPLALLIALCFAPLPQAALADSVMWSGGSSSDWHDDSNWVWHGHTPAAGDSATINTAGANAPEIGAGNSGAANIVVVGGGGNGQLSILGTLNTNTALLGNDNVGHAFTGTASISGGAANWSNSGNLVVGNYSVGALNILAGAGVTSASTYLGSEAGASGQASLSGSGSTLNAGSLYVGYAGSGTLNIGSGTTLNSTQATLGTLAGSTGSADVNGGSWSNGSGTLSIGNAGQGTLTIRNGGDLGNGTATIGSTASSAGSSATVNGAGSTWTSSGQLFVGINGSATLAVEAGASVSSAGGVIARYAGSTSSATVTGAGSSWTSTGSLHIGGDQGDPGSTGGQGTLNILAGATVNSQAAYLGDTALASGTVNVNNGNWTLSDRIGVGRFGTGSLSITNGGTVNSTGGLIGWNASSSGNSVSVTGNGSLWSMSGHLFVGNEGQGSLSITAGGDVSNHDGYIGSSSNALQSQATVSGAGSTWTNNGTVFVAYYNGAKGNLLVSAGGVVSATQQGIIGDQAGAVGSATVTGSGSSLGVAQDFNVGRFGNGSLNVLNGGSVSSNRTYIANEASASGTVVVSGSGSSLTSTGVTHVGSQGSGRLLLSDGGTLTAGSLHIAHSSGSTGVLSIGAEEGQAAAAAGQINSGTITLGNGSASLVLNHTSNSYTLASTITGNGTLKVLAGQSTLTASNTFTGTTEIANGAALTLATGAGLASAVSIASGGTLTAGTNSTGSLTNNGTLTLTRIDTNHPQLTINGNYTQGSGGRTEIAAWSANNGEYSRISASGSATLAGTLDIDVAGGSPLAPGNTLLQVISAATGVSGRYTTITDNSALFNFAAIYGANTVDLKIVSASANGVSDAIGSTGNTPGQGAAAVLDTVIASDPGGSLAALFIPLTGSQQISDAVSQTLPLLTGSSTVASQAALSGISQGINGRLGGRSGLSSGDNASRDQHFWVKPFASRIRQGDSDGVAGYRANIHGLTIGADRSFGAAVMGLAFSYANADIDSLSSTAPNSNRIDLYRLTGYGSHEIDESSQISWQVDIGSNDNHGKRRIGFAGMTARASFDSISAHAGVRLQKTLALGSATRLLPSIGLDYTWLRDEGYREKGAGALNLIVKSATSEQTLLSGDLAFSHALDESTSLLGNIGLGYDLQGGRSSLVASYAGAAGSNFETRGIAPGRLSLRGGLGFEKRTAAGATVLTRLDAERREHYTNYSASVNLRWLF